MHARSAGRTRFLEGLALVVAAGAIALLSCAMPVLADEEWRTWLENFGHDQFKYPHWVELQREDCKCSVKGLVSMSTGRVYVECRDSWTHKAERDALIKQLPYNPGMTWCDAKQWYMDHMPVEDQRFLPSAVGVHYDNMLEDQIAFALMALAQAPWADKLPKEAKFGYILPYATFHEARTNWRPNFFARFMPLLSKYGGTSKFKSTEDVMAFLTQPGYDSNKNAGNTFANFTSDNMVYPVYDLKPNPYFLQWSSSSTPPVLSPADFFMYGYGSCTAHSLLQVYVARALGVPARLAMTPCWNSDEFEGLAVNNKNVSQCWRGRAAYLNNHSWVEYWHSEQKRWVFLNAAASAPDFGPDSGLCSFTLEHGCDYDFTRKTCQNTRTARASQDHEIFAVTWSNTPDEEPPSSAATDQVSYLVEARYMSLTDGTHVTPLVWSPEARSPIGEAFDMNFINRTEHYRCRP